MQNTSRVIAIVDDDPDSQLRLKRAFAECRQDIRMDFFSADQELLDYLREGSGVSGEGNTPDLIIICLHLHGKTAFELIGRLKTDTDLRRIPIIVFDGQPSDPEIGQCYDLGANSVMTKPVLFDDLVQALKILCDFWLGPVRM